jgi:hypothetical protein
MIVAQSSPLSSPSARPRNSVSHAVPIPFLSFRQLSLIFFPRRSLTLDPSASCGLLNSLVAFFALPALCFQRLADSFAKTTSFFANPLCASSVLSTPSLPGASKGALSFHTSICSPFVFTTLRIAFPATPFFSQPSALPRGVGSPFSVPVLARLYSVLAPT